MIRNRSLADDLRRREPNELAAMLRARPDLVIPTPSSVSDVAARAGTVASVRMALHRLNRAELAKAWEVAGGGQPADDDASRRLWELGLLWTETEADAGSVEAGSAEAGSAEAGSAVAEGPAPVRRPVRALQDALASLGVPPPAQAVESVVGVDPVEAKLTEPLAGVDGVAGQQGLLAVQAVRALLRRLIEAPVGLTRDQLVPVRELTLLATGLGVRESHAARWLELGWLAGLLGPTEGAAALAPTVAGVAWSEASAARAWPVLLQSWWHADRDWAAFDVDDSDGERPRALGATHVSSAVPRLRHAWARILVAAPPHVAVRNVAAVLAEQRPLWDAERTRTLLATLSEEAELLGVTGRGALSTPGRLLVTDPPAPDPKDPVPEELLVDACAAVLPEEISQVLVQADHTIVAPGPLVGHLAAALEAFTEVESTGGATVYRISVASVQRGLEGGASAEEMLDLLRRSSLTEVPQPVEYLINDTADRHGRIRVHGPAAVVVTSDAAELDLVVAALTKSELRLRRVADTVALSEQPGSRLLAALRSAGVAAVGDRALGVDAGAEAAAESAQHRWAPPPSLPAPVAHAVEPGRAQALAEALLAPLPAEGQAMESPAAPDVPRMHAAQIQAVLAEGLLASRRLWVRHADNAGMDSCYLVMPLHLAGGALEAIELTRNSPRRFAVSRIIGVVQA